MIPFNQFRPVFLSRLLTFSAVFEVVSKWTPAEAPKYAKDALADARAKLGKAIISAAFEHGGLLENRHIPTFEIAEALRSHPEIRFWEADPYLPPRMRRKKTK